MLASAAANRIDCTHKDDNHTARAYKISQICVSRSERVNVGININTQNDDECVRNNTTTSTNLTHPSGPINKRKRQNGEDDLSYKLIQLEENKLRLLENQT